MNNSRISCFVDKMLIVNWLIAATCFHSSHRFLCLGDFYRDIAAIARC